MKGIILGPESVVVIAPDLKVQKVAVERTRGHIRMNLAEYFEKGIENRKYYSLKKGIPVMHMNKKRC